MAHRQEVSCCGPKMSLHFRFLPISGFGIQTIFMSDVKKKLHDAFGYPFSLNSKSITFSHVPHTLQKFKQEFKITNEKWHWRKNQMWKLKVRRCIAQEDETLTLH